jgi:hypothetical protein
VACVAEVRGVAMNGNGIGAFFLEKEKKKDKQMWCVLCILGNLMPFFFPPEKLANLMRLCLTTKCVG